MTEENQISLNDIADAENKLTELSKSRSKKSKFVDYITVGVSGIATAAAVGAFSIEAFTVSDISSRLLGSSASPEVIKELALQRDYFQGKIDSLERQLESAVVSEISDSRIAELLQNNSMRITGLERTLDVQPREIIELVRLKDDLESIEQDLDDRFAINLREIDRAYNTVLALIGALLVAVISMVIGNFIRSKNTG